MSKPTYVYFIRPVGMVGPIKIGCSELPEGRLASLAAWSPYPLEIVVTIAGGIKLERNIHECFADLHSHHEWFRPGQRLLEAIDKLKRRVPIDQAVNLDDRRGTILKRKCGGAQWTDVTRQKMSVLHRVRHAAVKLGSRSHRHAPLRIQKLVDISEDRILSADELAVIAEFCDDPFAFKEEADADFAAWRAQVFKSDRAPSPSTEEAA